MFKLSARRYPSHLLQDALLSDQKRIQKEPCATEIPMTGSELLVSEPTFPEHHKYLTLKYLTLGAQRAAHSHSQQPKSQLLQGRGECPWHSTSHWGTLWACGLWCLRKNGNRFLNCCKFSPSQLPQSSRTGRNAEGACSHNPSEPEYMQELVQKCKSSQTHYSPAQIYLCFDWVYLQPREAAATVSLSAKGGSAWGQHSSNLKQRRSKACPNAHRAAAVQPQSLGDTAQAAGGNGSTSNSSKHKESGTQKLLPSI